ncbi:LysR family transcriptional regulator [Acetonema longum]|uniref:Transcriptional regulator n=1 Tax=Acetonema longum DSM 6540 TaxID=1009370 RepID=F7NP81_9FIRM|nr:LysR family transcriptional regulator [Acetonema longum]EGO62204.1 transcriptional regulator [Acetonema longum DSM 6540]
MDERDWIILQTLHQKKNITRTAEALFISQPTLTSRLQQIEDRFDVQIVVRGKKGVYFTPEGAYLAECSKEMLQKMHTIEGTVRTLKNEVKGLLKLGASNFFTRHKLPELLRRFQERYPEVEFKVVTNLSGRIVDLVYNHDIDVGFIRGEYGWSDKKELLFEENMYIVSAWKISCEQLPEKPRIDYISNKAVRDVLDNWWKDNFHRPPHIGMNVDRIDSCKEMVLKNLGYAFLPSGILDAEDQVYKIQMFDRAGMPLVRRTWMFYYEDKLQIALIKTFVDFVKSIDVYSL